MILNRIFYFLLLVCFQAMTLSGSAEISTSNNFVSVNKTHTNSNKTTFFSFIQAEENDEDGNEEDDFLFFYVENNSIFTDVISNRESASFSNDINGIGFIHSKPLYLLNNIFRL
ncbi:MAG: hypothetical protein HYZ42_07200 [Bacteroidetes bacterium]|nr:hypothetical protein [Bacteroidota bacterium]